MNIHFTLHHHNTGDSYTITDSYRVGSQGQLSAQTPEGETIVLGPNENWSIRSEVPE